ncbi:MAG: PHP domain-containing protein [Lachnospiraceae bacterium]|nr:PHP domain-containing protein [Lachnospiraceae bacterium]
MNDLILRGNFHTHTCLCDGVNTPAEVADKAFELGFEILGFSGHMDPDIHMELPEYLRAVKQQQDRYEGRMEILCGIELDHFYVEEVFGADWEGSYVPLCIKSAEGKTSVDNTDLTEELLAPLDYVIGSSHFIRTGDGTLIPVDYEMEKLSEGCERYFDGDYYKMAAAYYEQEAQVYTDTHCTFVGHFDLITRFNDGEHFLDEEDHRYRDAALTSMEHLVRQGVPFEINCGAVNRGRKKEFYPNQFLLKNLKEFGGEIIINSDAHHMDLLSGAFSEALAAAEAAGFTHVNILTKKETGKLQLQPVEI